MDSEHFIEFEFDNPNSSNMSFQCDGVDGNQLAALAHVMVTDTNQFIGPHLVANGPVNLKVTFLDNHTLLWVVDTTAGPLQVIAAASYLRVYGERLMAMSIMAAEAETMANKIEVARAIPGLVS